MLPTLIITSERARTSARARERERRERQTETDRERETEREGHLGWVRDGRNLNPKP